MIEVIDDFDLFHIVLFYLYTDRVYFSTTPETALVSGILATSNAETIYEIAHRLLLDSLTSKALHFLKSTCTPHNITARVFGSFASLHDDVGKLYNSYLMENWNQIVRTSEFKEFLSDLEEDSMEYIQLRSMMHTRRGKLEDEVSKPPGWNNMQMYKSFLRIHTHVFKALLTST